LEIAELLEGELNGDPNIIIKGISGIREAEEGDITFLANRKYYSLMQTTRASAVIIPKDISFNLKPIIKVENPSLAFAKLISIFSPMKVAHPKGIHPTALIGKDVELGKDIGIGAYTVICDNVKIGDRTIVYSGCYIGHHTIIGSDTLIYPNVTVREEIKIGSRVIIHSGTVIGCDGFGYATVGGIHHKIPQVGIVEIGDDVEIGANVTIDRARFNKTVIGKGTKIDNLVQIAHNVIIGQNCIIVAQTGISGSTTIGKGVILAGQTGIVGHITIGDGAVVAAQSGVSKSVACG
jgi:UDP-3-O-[3-hydroxymyristoyl] glucosamine N-acyltransferase